MLTLRPISLPTQYQMTTLRTQTPNPSIEGMPNRLRRSVPSHVKR